MNITVPIVNAKDVEPLVKVGADEFYCGLYVGALSENINFAVLNKRPSLKMNFHDYESFGEAVRIAHAYNKKVYLTVNAVGYIGEFYDYVREMILKAYELGVDGYIVSDLGIIKIINDFSFKTELHISTTAVVYNSEAVKFLKKMGATRIIFPRHIGINEMSKIVEKDPSLEYEVFMLNGRCPNEDGLCMIEHSMNYYQKINGCFFSRKFKRHNEVRMERFCEFINNACGACDIPFFMSMPIDSLKIVGRENPLRKRMKDTIFLKRILNYINSAENVNTDYNKVITRIRKELYLEDCSGYRNCYYPKVKERK